MRIQITVPRNTPISTPLAVNINYPGDVIDRIDVGIPPGHAYLTGIQMFVGNLSARAIPDAGSNISFLVDDGTHVVSQAPPGGHLFQFDMPSFKLIFKCYNLSTFYAHTFTIDLD